MAMGLPFQQPFEIAYRNPITAWHYPCADRLLLYNGHRNDRLCIHDHRRDVFKTARHLQEPPVPDSHYRPGIWRLQFRRVAASAQAIDLAQHFWLPTSFTAIVTLIIFCYVGWWYQRH